MKILIFCDKAFALSETFIYRQIKCLDSHDIDLVCRKRLNGSNFPLPNSIKVKVLYRNLFFRLAYKLWGRQFKHPWIIEDYFRKKLRKEKYDLIMCFYGLQAIKLISVVKEFQVPFYVSFHGFDATRMLRVPGYKDSLKQLFEFSRCVKTPCNFLANELLEIGLEKEKSKVVYNGVDVDYIDSINGSSEERDYCTILHVGRLVANKGVLDLLRVFEKLREEKTNVRLRIAGFGQMKEHLVKFVSDSQLSDYVDFLGPISNQQAIQEMKNADVFVLNSQIDQNGETEGFPNVILEAMASGVPIVSTYHAGIPEAIENEVHGLLVNEKDNESLLLSIKRLIDDKPLAKQLSRNARIRVSQEFSNKVLCEKMNSVVESIIK